MCMLFLASQVDFFFLTLHLLFEGSMVLFNKTRAKKKVTHVMYVDDTFLKNDIPSCMFVKKKTCKKRMLMNKFEFGCSVNMWF